MATETEAASAARPDAQYAFVAGCYVAALLGPGLVLGLAAVVADPAVLYVGFLVVITATAAVAGWVVSHVDGLATGLGRRDAVWVLGALPFGWFGAAFVGVDGPSLLVPLAVFGTAAGALLGLALVAMSRTRYANAACARAVDLATWEARWPRRWRRAAGAVAVGSFAVSAAGIVAAVGFGVEWGWQLYYLLFVAVPFTNVLNPRTFRVTDRGLVVERPLQRTFRPWSAFAGYDRTDAALVIRPTAWWRPAHRCDLTDVEDVDAVVTALDEALGRTAGPTNH